MEKINEEKFEIRDLRKKEKFFVDDLYLNGYAKKCGIYATGVYLSLCRHADKGQRCWPSYKKMAEELNISPKQVGRSIKALESLNIIKKMRVGKKLNNRYLLLDKSEWVGSPITKDPQSNHPQNDSPIHSKDTHLSEQNNNESFSKKELAEAYKTGSRRLKPYYRGEEMRWARNKWQVIPKDGGRWLEFADDESKIDWIKKYDRTRY